MLRLQAFKVIQKEDGSASLAPGDRTALKAITEFGAKPYTEDEEKVLSKIVQAFNDRHGTEFTEADMLRFEQVNREMLDEDMTEMLRSRAAVKKRQRYEKHYSQRSGGSRESHPPFLLSDAERSTGKIAMSCEHDEENHGRG